LDHSNPFRRNQRKAAANASVQRAAAIAEWRLWLAINSGIDELTVNGLAMDPSNPAVLYACGPNGVYKTVTGGEEQSASMP
jgi:hypothetical protein